ncbi:exopolysaccharide biosynthesis polyprenyl glycosylphosphotransferase [Cellulomonas sp. JZ18]|uniref:sugar transferase n=1 Tax=Cellulomonas sp. JZ18 TaxID=2654191 RepID=UPI0012D4682A|nr:sugar transferase [Cellulomonas sp. JZ18]QGQ20256.1 exopolysaccharide biosynthesis polyprenyl glycosylphosphotransferase [Cellulomonas sp. JZ18]
MSAMVGVTARDLTEADAASAAASSTHWARSYADRIALTDAVALALAVGLAYAVRFPLDGRVDAVVSGEFSPTYMSVSVVLFAAWFTALTVGRTRDRRLVGAGPSEYARVLEVTWHLFAGVAIVAFMFRMEIGRGYLAIAAPLGLGLVLLGRLLWRRQLHRRRDRGLDRSPVLVVGPLHKVGALIKEFHRNPRAGYEVVGVCVSGVAPPRGHQVHGVPVLGTQDDAARVARERGVAAVAVAGSDAMTADAARRLAWDLEGTGVDMALTLSLTDVAGPRVLMRPVNGLPLVYVDEPRFTGSKYVVKSLFDWVGALVITVLVSPLLLVLAVLVKATSRGPVLYKQERIGKDGQPFHMLKFRSMQVDAHEKLEEVLAAEGVTELGAFYKPRNDPRVTPVGRVLRRYSLDELPQLFNVLRGEMSLVGPRPQIEAEVATYDRAAHRRLLVKPGLTGLWQVSGRSSLPPETAMRLDVSYVENWTLFGDVMLLARTLRAVVGRDGAR